MLLHQKALVKACQACPVAPSGFCQRNQLSKCYTTASCMHSMCMSDADPFQHFSRSEAQMQLHPSSQAKHGTTGHVAVLYQYVFQGIGCLCILNCWLQEPLMAGKVSDNNIPHEPLAMPVNAAAIHRVHSACVLNIVQHTPVPDKRQSQHPSCTAAPSLAQHSPQRWQCQV